MSNSSVNDDGTADTGNENFGEGTATDSKSSTPHEITEATDSEEKRRQDSGHHVTADMRGETAKGDNVLPSDHELKPRCTADESLILNDASANPGHSSTVDASVSLAVKRPRSDSPPICDKPPEKIVRVCNALPDEPALPLLPVLPEVVIANPRASQDAKLYQKLKKYILSESQLLRGGYPRSGGPGGKVSNVHADRFAPPILPNPRERICYRCKTRFSLKQDGSYEKQEKCNFHNGGVWNNRHTCCQRSSGSNGCETAENHVHRQNRYTDFDGYIKTVSKSPCEDSNYGIFCLDCEMVYTTFGLELAQVTVVGPDLKPVLDEFVKPDHPVSEWNTKYSGITADMMTTVTTTLKDVQAKLLELFNDKTILIGHSLDSDLVAVKLIHNTIVDTSVVFPHKTKSHLKRSLREIVTETLHRSIQRNPGGHDSCEDAVACMEVMLWKINH